MILLPTLDGDLICIRYLSEPLSTDPIHGITAPKVYPYKPLPVHIVSFYLTFSPFPPLPEVVIFCGTVSFPIAQEAGYSPVGCSVLSGLSFTPGVTIARDCSKAKIWLIFCKMSFRQNSDYSSFPKMAGRFLFDGNGPFISWMVKFLSINNVLGIPTILYILSFARLIIH